MWVKALDTTLAFRLVVGRCRYNVNLSMSSDDHGFLWSLISFGVCNKPFTHSNEHMVGEKLVFVFCHWLTTQLLPLSLKLNALPHGSIDFPIADVYSFFLPASTIIDPVLAKLRPSNTVNRSHKLVKSHGTRSSSEQCHIPGISSRPWNSVSHGGLI